MSEAEFAVELAEGFADDDVTVFVDGNEVWHGSGVTTNYSVGIADVVRVPAPPAYATVEVRVGSAAGSVAVDATAASGEIRLRATFDTAGSVAVEPATDEPRY